VKYSALNASCAIANCLNWVGESTDIRVGKAESGNRLDITGYWEARRIRDYNRMFLQASRINVHDFLSFDFMD
jgi:hypothetical protein